MILQMREDAVRIVQVDDVDDPNGRTPPPIWIIVFVVLAVVAGGWLLVSQGSTDSDVVTSSTFALATPDAVSESTPRETVPTVSPSAADSVPSIFGPPMMSVRSDTPRELRGDVALASPEFLLPNQTLWVFRDGGRLVSRGDSAFGSSPDRYPMLMTAGHVLIDRVNGWIVDVDLVDRATMLGTNRSLIPGAEPGLVWFGRRENLARGQAEMGDYLWVAPVDVESRTVGERVDITDLFSRPLVGVADGLIVVPVEEKTYGRFAYWSPTDGLVPLYLRDPDRDTVVTASGDLVVVASSGSVSVLDIASGDYLSSFAFNFGEAVTSACLSPDRQHVIVVGSNGGAVVGNTTTGEVIVLELNEYYDLETFIQREHGIGWTTDDQIVFIAGDEDPKDLFGFDIATGESFSIAGLDGPGDWWLTASGTMC
jgi:hypothetical protein